MTDPATVARATDSNRAELERVAAGVLMAGFPDPTVPDGTAELIARGVRSFILFARNIRSADGVTSLSAGLRALAGDDILLAIDHEGGRVNRLDGAGTPWPSPMAWAAAGDLDLTRQASAESARELRTLGINVNFAPVADLLGSHHNPVLGVRCFSDSPEIVAGQVSAFIAGHREANVGTTAKHFPGHGATSIDSHVDMPAVDLALASLESSDLIPFKAAIASGVDCLMISHIWYSALDERSMPATLSRRVMDLARNDLGYDGVIVTDCMEMGAIQTRMSTAHAVVQAIKAGADLAIVSHRLDLQRAALGALVDALLDGTLPRSRVTEATRRLDVLRAHVRPAPLSAPRGGLDLAHRIARQSVTLVRDERGFLPLRLAASDTLGIVTFRSGRPTGIENEHIADSPLSELVRRRHSLVVDVRVDETLPLPDLGVLRAADAIVVGTSFTTGHPRQRDLVTALLGWGKPVIVLALSDPFDLLSFPEAPCYIATYGDTAPQLDAALAVLLGTAQPAGHLPVALGDFYPRGHGITEI